MVKEALHRLQLRVHYARGNAAPQQRGILRYMMNDKEEEDDGS